MTERHVAKIRLEERLLLKILDFEGGTIWHVGEPNEFGIMHLIVEHPDLPIVGECEPYPEILPTYESHYGDDNSLLSITRIDPPKCSAIKEDQ